MKKSKIAKAVENKANVQNAEKIFCDRCNEHLIFLLKDSKGNEFSVGLATMLDCLAFAVKSGDLPKLPVSWLYNVDHMYLTEYSDDDDILYYDYPESEKATPKSC